MSKPPVSPDPDSVGGLFTGVYKPQLVRIALTLDVFTPLLSGPVDAQAVARACGCSPTGIRLLLDYLSSIGLLEHNANNYALTPRQPPPSLCPKSRVTWVTWYCKGQPPKPWKVISGHCVAVNPTLLYVPGRKKPGFKVMDRRNRPWKCGVWRASSRGGHHACASLIWHAGVLSRVLP